MEEWKKCKLKDITSLITKGTTPSMIGANFTTNGINFIKSECILENSRLLDSSKYTFISSETNERLKRSQIIENDILFSMAGMFLGKTGIATKDDVPANTNQAVAIIRIISEKADFKYVYYFLNQKTLITYINGISGQSAQPNINLQQIGDLEIKLPSLPTQQKIAAILSSLDDKIELNNKINTNLEQQAGALFKNWFVDFEPFGGEMPGGWKEGKLSDIADYLNGLAMQKFRPLEGEEGLPVLKIKELRQGCCDEGSELCSPSKVKSEYIIHDGDVIFSWSGSLLVDIWCGGTCGLNQHLFKVTSQKYSKWFYYLWTKHHLDRFIFLAADKATTMGHIKREELDKAEVIIPDDKNYQQITSVIEPIIDEIINNRIENRKLAQIRDVLLPKLMNGEIFCCNK
jgi:type I restriction enzyme S subunit